MGTILLNSPVVLEATTCAECGVEFAMPRHFMTMRREDHRQFFCINGHQNFYPAETEAERLKKTLEAQRALTNAAEQRARKAETKLKRTKVGVCPCCNRTFKQLAAHMQTKHPKWNVNDE